MRYGSVQNAEIHLFCSENRNFFKKIPRNFDFVVLYCIFGIKSEWEYVNLII